MKYAAILFFLGLMAGCASSGGVDAGTKRALTDLVLADFPTDQEAEGNEPTRDMVEIDEIRTIRGHNNLYGVRLRYFGSQGYALLIRYDGRDVTQCYSISPLQGAFVKSLDSAEVREWSKPLIVATICVRSSVYWNLYEIRGNSMRCLISCRVEHDLRLVDNHSGSICLRPNTLRVKYRDINADGYTDVVLMGRLGLASKSNLRVEKVVPWERVYLYNSGNRTYRESPRHRKGVKNKPREFRD